MKIMLGRANGRLVTHCMEPGWRPTPGDRVWPAVCGYTPSSPTGHLIKGRGRWADRTAQMEPVEALDKDLTWCPRCRKKVENMLDSTP